MAVWWLSPSSFALPWQQVSYRELSSSKQPGMGEVKSVDLSCKLGFLSLPTVLLWLHANVFYLSTLSAQSRSLSCGLQ